MAVKPSGRDIIERQVKRGLNALDEAVAMFRKNGQEAWANDIADVRDFIARNRAYYDRLSAQHARHAPDARAVAQVMWSEIQRRGK
jgi:hypothetical protein